MCAPELSPTHSTAGRRLAPVGSAASVGSLFSKYLWHVCSVAGTVPDTGGQQRTVSLNPRVWTPAGLVFRIPGPPALIPTCV